jgi:CheY-like chemotaxis protein
VTLANNGKEAVALWEANPDHQFDLILMDGLQATAHIREKERAVHREQGPAHSREIHIPIIAMTAHAMKGDREYYLAGGRDGYISKPSNPTHLEIVIQAVADRPAKISEVVPPLKTARS